MTRRAGNARSTCYDLRDEVDMGPYLRNMEIQRGMLLNDSDIVGPTRRRAH